MVYTIIVHMQAKPVSRACDDCCLLHAHARLNGERYSGLRREAQEQVDRGLASLPSGQGDHRLARDAGSQGQSSALLPRR